MARPRPSDSGRVTPKKQPIGAADDGIPPLRVRKPVMFWVIVLAALAMVLSTLTGFISLLA